MNTLVNFLAVFFCEAGNWLIIALAVVNIGIFLMTRSAIKKADNL